MIPRFYRTPIVWRFIVRSRRTPDRVLTHENTLLRSRSGFFFRKSPQPKHTCVSFMKAGPRRDGFNSHFTKYAGESSACELGVFSPQFRRSG